MSDEKKTRKVNPVVKASRVLASAVENRDKLKEKVEKLEAQLKEAKDNAVLAETQVKNARKAFDDVVAGNTGG